MPGDASDYSFNRYPRRPDLELQEFYNQELRLKKSLAGVLFDSR